MKKVTKRKIIEWVTKVLEYLLKYYSPGGVGKIAVFGHHKEFVTMQFLPKKKFRLISSIEDVCEGRWIGVILLYGWDRSERSLNAYKYLKIRRPELFEK